jgi:UDP-N-acetylglucosamine 4-epimerase
MDKRLIGKRVLITGGAGFIGSNLAEYFVENNKVCCLDNLSTGHMQNIESLLKHPNFTFVEADIVDFQSCLDATIDIDVIFHQAALGSVPRSIKQPLMSNASNITGFLNMIEAARQNGVKRFIYAASSSTYGDSYSLPKVEDEIGAPLSPYAVTKYVNELYAGVYSRLHDMETIGLRYFNVFGRRQDPEGAYAAVIPKFIDLLLRGTSPTINGDGEQTRDFTHIDNVILANELSAVTTNSEALNTVYNVACGSYVSLNSLFHEIRSILIEHDPSIQNIEVTHGPERIGDVRSSLASIEKATANLDYRPIVHFSEGLTRSVGYYIDSLKVN